MFSNKKIIIIAAITVIIGGGLYFRGANLLKKLAGYNVPPLEEPKTSEVNDPSLSFLNLPEGFEINVFAKNLENPRVLTFDPNGSVLVSETKAGRVVLLENGENGIADTKKVLLSGLNKPHGLAFYSSGNTTYLYVAETQQVARYIYDVKNKTVIPAKGENITNLPADGRHFTRTISFGPNFRETPLLPGKRGDDTLADTKLYISVGSSCDVCVEDTTWKRAAILESDPTGTFTAEFAGGLRNSVFFTFHPVTKEIWATEMGRDNLGDNLPPDEVNIVKVAGPEDKFGAKRYGWPFCYGNQVMDKTFNPEKIERIDISSDCAKTESPVIQIQAHSAPLGLVFIPSNSGWPKEWAGDLLVAFHGSWNRSEPVGYKIVRYDLDINGNVLSQEPEDFILGWLGENGKIFGRPVDLKFGPDNSLYITDDAIGAIYRVTPTSN
ncbi:MAG: PQQ-dependent sugar dehydrogenase [Patescibacteria group bacterium]